MPGDKSISHRAAMVAALAEGMSHIKNFSPSTDCAATLLCLQQLGVRIEHQGRDVLVYGVGAEGLRKSEEVLDCGNSGTTMRLLAGVLAGQNFQSTLTGDASLRSRPMQRIIEPLEMMGASISSNDGCAPLVIQGRRPLMAVSYELLIASAQVKSCILLAGLSAEGRTEVIESRAAANRHDTEPLAVASLPAERTPHQPLLYGTTRDHTERILRWFGVPVEERDGKLESSHTIAVDGPATLNARDVSIPGDVSSAAFFVAAAALLPGSELEIENVGLNPTRDQFLATLEALDANISRRNLREDCHEPSGRIFVRGESTFAAPRIFASTDSEPHRPVCLELTRLIRGRVISQLIDELPLLAVIGSQIKGGIEIRDAAELRVKESDRIQTTVENLRAMGADVEEFEDGLRVAGPTQLRGALLDPRADHRMAMAFTVAGLVAEGETEIKGADCVAVSTPEFFDLLDQVVER
jgi:3-phosphoshikimate 1-carboxyvinyltransferase